MTRGPLPIGRPTFELVASAPDAPADGVGMGEHAFDASPQRLRSRVLALRPFADGLEAAVRMRRPAFMRQDRRARANGLPAYRAGRWRAVRNVHAFRLIITPWAGRQAP
jgi:hypothetical protein